MAAKVAQKYTEFTRIRGALYRPVNKQRDRALDTRNSSLQELT